MTTFSRTCWIALLLLSTSSFAQQPNMLWLTIEDILFDFIDCNGNTNTSIQNLNRLTREGVRFTNTFSIGTVGSSTQSTIITGLCIYEMGTGNHRSGYPIPEKIKTFPVYGQEPSSYATNNSKTDYPVANPKQLTQEVSSENYDQGLSPVAYRGKKYSPYG